MRGTGVILKNWAPSPPQVLSCFIFFLYKYPTPAVNFFNRSIENHEINRHKITVCRSRRLPHECIIPEQPVDFSLSPQWFSIGFPFVYFSYVHITRRRCTHISIPVKRWLSRSAVFLGRRSPDSIALRIAESRRNSLLTFEFRRIQLCSPRTSRSPFVPRVYRAKIRCKNNGFQVRRGEVRFSTFVLYSDNYW